MRERDREGPPRKRAIIVYRSCGHGEITLLRNDVESADGKPREVNLADRNFPMGTDLEEVERIACEWLGDEPTVVDLGNCSACENPLA